MTSKEPSERKSVWDVACGENLKWELGEQRGRLECGSKAARPFSQQEVTCKPQSTVSCGHSTNVTNILWFSNHLLIDVLSSRGAS